MDLDFTKLNNLAFDEKESFKASTEPEPEGEEEHRQSQQEADSQKQDIDRYLNIYREYQSNAQVSSQLQTEILKGARSGEDIYNLFLKAVKAISVMTANNLFYVQLEKDIMAIYGQGLLNPLPLKRELQETRERLAKLREAGERELETDVRERIERAKTAHEEKVTELERLLTKAETP